MSPQFYVHCDDFYKTEKEEEATSMTTLWSSLTGFIHIKKKRTDLSIRGSTLRECTKKMDQEARVPTSTESDENQNAMGQESLEKYLREGDERQPKTRRSSRENLMIDDKIKEQELLSRST